MSARGITMVLRATGSLLVFVAGHGCLAPLKANPEAVAKVPAEVGPAEAKRLLESNQGYVYLDVRTAAEFEAGHVPNAWNVPVLVVNETTGRKERNSEFLSVIGGAVSKDAPVIVGCRSGRRSALAFELMREAGYRRTANMVGGLFGSRDAAGELRKPGWTTLGFKTDQGDGGERSYKSLAARSAP